jgi:DNA-binding CsgD family transcriptional regulator
MVGRPTGTGPSQARGYLGRGHPTKLGWSRSSGDPYDDRMTREELRRTRGDIARLAQEGLDWVAYSAGVSEIIGRVVAFQRSCWHTVDPGTVLFTGSLNHNISCSGTWLAEHEYVVEDVNKWWFLARSGRRAGATSLATHGDLSRCVRHRSHAEYGIGDELRGSFVVDGSYWGAAGFLRERDEPWFTPHEVDFLAALSDVIGEGLRRAMLVTIAPPDVRWDGASAGPGVVVFDEHGDVESISPAAEHWIADMVEVPAPPVPSESKIVQAVAAQARLLRDGQDPLELSARARARTRSGHWLLLYGTRLTGPTDGRTAVIIQPAAPNEVAPLVALAYGLTEREAQVTRLCLRGDSTKEIAQALFMSTHTVQDHFKSIFGKTGVRSRGQLVGQIFLEHFVPRWEDVNGCPPGWTAVASLRHPAKN